MAVLGGVAKLMVRTAVALSSLLELAEGACYPVGSLSTMQLADYHMVCRSRMEDKH
jgi:hypothetical protein